MHYELQQLRGNLTILVRPSRVAQSAHMEPCRYRLAPMRDLVRREMSGAKPRPTRIGAGDVCESQSATPPLMVGAHRARTIAFP
jgi:hypothetical protein